MRDELPRPRDDKRLTREDLLQVAISLVKSEGAHAQPAEFMSDVASTFEALSQEMQATIGSRDRGTSVAAPWRASHRGIDDPYEPGLGRSKAS